MNEDELHPLVDELIEQIKKGMQNFYIHHMDIPAPDIMVLNSSALTYLLGVFFYTLTKNIDQELIDSYTEVLSHSFKKTVNQLMEKKKTND